jgi:probable 2-oxoglutarate dehydrogenase E1 component DHKTD1
MQILWPSTAAQYYHLLRRQMVRDYRKPATVVMPKTLLRLGGSMSEVGEMGPGTFFKTVIDEPLGNTKSAKKVIVTCGKHYFTLLDERKKRGLEKEVALIRLEQLVPFPSADINGDYFQFCLLTLKLPYEQIILKCELLELRNEFINFASACPGMKI